MIPTLMMIAGGIVGLFGLLWTLYIAITPILVKMRSINGEGELVETARIRRIRIRDRKYLIKISLSMLLVGLLVLFSGVYLLRQVGKLSRVVFSQGKIVRSSSLV